MARASRITSTAIPALLATLALTIGGCALLPFRDGSRQPTTATTPQTPMLTDPAQILALAHLTLPDGATGITVATNADLVAEGYYYSYAVSWHGTIDTTNTFLDQAGMNLDSMPATGSSSNVDSYIRSQIGVATIPQGSKSNHASFKPSHGFGQWWVLAEAPDFTTVHVAVSAFPS